MGGGGGGKIFREGSERKRFCQKHLSGLEKSRFGVGGGVGERVVENQNMGSASFWGVAKYRSDSPVNIWHDLVQSYPQA